MSIDLTKAPWPEWEELSLLGDNCYGMTQAEYDFARLYINSHANAAYVDACNAVYINCLEELMSPEQLREAQAQLQKRAPKMP